MSVVDFCCWVSSFSLIFPHRTQLNRILKLSEERLRSSNRYYETRWWTQILVGQGGSGLNPTCYIILEIKTKSVKIVSVLSSYIFRNTHSHIPSTALPLMRKSPVVVEGNLAAATQL